jgi:hypothetical protein
MGLEKDGSLISNKPRIKSIPKNKLSTEPVYFDMSLDADGVGNPQTYSDTFKDTVTKVIKKGKDGKKDITKSYDIEKKTNYVKVHHEHDRDFYKILSSSNSNFLASVAGIFLIAFKLFITLSYVPA